MNSVGYVEQCKLHVALTAYVNTVIFLIMQVYTTTNEPCHFYKLRWMSSKLFIYYITLGLDSKVVYCISVVHLLPGSNMACRVM